MSGLRLIYISILACGAAFRQLVQRLIGGRLGGDAVLHALLSQVGKRGTVTRTMDSHTQHMSGSLGGSCDTMVWGWTARSSGSSPGSR